MRFDKFFLEHEGTGRYYVRGEDGWRVGEIIGAAGNWTAWFSGTQYAGFKTRKSAAEYIRNIKKNQDRFWKGELCGKN